MKKELLILALPGLLLTTNMYAKNIRLGIGSANFNCSTQICFSAESSMGFDRKSDKLMKSLPDNPVNYIFTTDGKHRMLVNHCPEPVSFTSIPVMISVRDTGMFDLLLEDLTGDMNGFEFTLTDLSDMQVIKMTPGLSQSIRLKAADYRTMKKFKLNIFASPTIHSTPVSCTANKDGSVFVRFHSNGTWQAKLRTMSGTVMELPAASNDVLFENLAAGVYYVEGWQNNMKIWEELVSVSSPKGLKPKFRIPQDTIEAGQQIFIDNLSSGASYFLWESDNGFSSHAYNPVFTFSKAGTYTITLTAADYPGCIAVKTETIFVKAEENPIVEDSTSSVK